MNRPDALTQDHPDDNLGESERSETFDARSDINLWNLVGPTAESSMDLNCIGPPNLNLDWDLWQPDCIPNVSPYIDPVSTEDINIPVTTDNSCMDANHGSVMQNNRDHSSEFEGRNIDTELPGVGSDINLWNLISTPVESSTDLNGMNLNLDWDLWQPDYTPSLTST